MMRTIEGDTPQSREIDVIAMSHIPVFLVGGLNYMPSTQSI